MASLYSFLEVPDDLTKVLKHSMPFLGKEFKCVLLIVLYIISEKVIHHFDTSLTLPNRLDYLQRPRLAM
jgi:hypothetical protein